jgi:hypothetical protein
MLKNNAAQFGIYNVSKSLLVSIEFQRAISQFRSKLQHFQNNKSCLLLRVCNKFKYQNFCFIFLLFDVFRTFSNNFIIQFYILHIQTIVLVHIYSILSINSGKISIFRGEIDKEQIKKCYYTIIFFYTFIFEQFLKYVKRYKRFFY